MKQNNTKIRVCFIFTEKVIDIEENTREGRIRRKTKEVVGCVQAMVGIKTFPFKIEDRKKREMSYT